MRQIIVEKTYEHPLTETEKRVFPAGWAGPVEAAIAEAIVAAGSGRIDPDREAAVAATEAAAAAEKAAAEAAAEAAAKAEAEAQAGAKGKGKGKGKPPADEGAAPDPVGA